MKLAIKFSLIIWLISASVVWIAGTITQNYPMATYGLLATCVSVWGMSKETE